MTGWSLALFLLGKGAPIWCAASAALMFVSFLGLAGSAENISPGFRQEFMLILVLSLAGFLLLAGRMEPGSFEAGRMTLEGTVQKERPWGRGRLVILDSDEGRFAVHLPPSDLFREGDVITVKGFAEPPDPHPGGRGFDEGTYWSSRGVEGIFRHASAELSGKRSWGIPRWRSMLRERILITLPPQMRGYILAAWLGSRDPDLAARHSVWGTSHLLAVSGLHVGIVVLILFSLIPARSFRFSIASLVMWLYVLVAGASSSAMRAGLMLQAGFVGRWIGRPLAAVNTVSVAGLLLLLWRPWFFWDLGWRLSMLAALLLSSNHDLGAKKGWLLAPLLLWICTAGLVSDAFGTVPVAGIVVNMVAVPVFRILLPVASLLALPALAGMPGGFATVDAGEMLFSAWAYFADMVTVLLPWKVQFSNILNIAGVLLASFLLLRGIGFGRIPATVFAGAIMLCLTIL